MGYKEPLPDACPPLEASEDAIAEAYRMVFSNPPTAKDFQSKKALGLVPNGDEDDCGFASCSLWADLNKITRLAQLPGPRSEGALVAKVVIPAGSGRWVKNKKKHIHFWMYEDFDPCASANVVP